MNVVDRFLQYVAFETTSDENTEDFPSSARELDLERFLEKEIRELGMENVEMDENGYVYGHLPATPGVDAPSIGLMAHVDVSCAVSGRDIKPNRFVYQGGDIVLNPETVMREEEFPFLKNYIGKEIITTDGTTLLGADDKAGIAEIVCAVEYLLAHPEVKHGPISVCFNPDEEVGRGTERIDLEKFGAEYAYTIDGGSLGEFEYECFNAAGLRVKINGLSVHPGKAKNIMKNAILIAKDFISMLPPAEVPEHTEGYEGFYHMDGIEGNEQEVRLSLIVRDHDKEKFLKRKEFVKNIVAYLNGVYGEGTLELTVSDTYYNMRELIEPHREIIDRALGAFRECGVEPVIMPIRGGTDGAGLTFKGVPCPNLSVGGENFHGVLEFACVPDMEKMVDVIVKMIEAK